MVSSLITTPEHKSVYEGHFDTARRYVIREVSQGLSVKIVDKEEIIGGGKSTITYLKDIPYEQAFVLTDSDPFNHKAINPTICHHIIPVSIRRRIAFGYRNNLADLDRMISDNFGQTLNSELGRIMCFRPHTLIFGIPILKSSENALHNKSCISDNDYKNFKDGEFPWDNTFDQTMICLSVLMHSNYIHNPENLMSMEEIFYENGLTPSNLQDELNFINIAKNFILNSPYYRQDLEFLTQLLKEKQFQFEDRTLEEISTSLERRF